MSGSIPVRQRKRSAGQLRQLQTQRIVSTVVHAEEPGPINLNDLFPAKEVLGRDEKSGAYVLPQDVGQRFRYIERYHHPEPEIKPGKTRATRNTDQKLNPYTEDFIFQTLHQLILAGIPIDQIALRFDVSVATIYKWRTKMMKKMADEVKEADPLPILGETLSTYRAIAAEGHRMMMQGRTANDKRAGAEVALKALGDQQKVLQMAGFFDNPLLKVNTNSDDSRTKGATSLMDMAKQFLLAAPSAPPEPEHRKWSEIPEGARLVDVEDEDDDA
jgi:hypothetical protein